MIDDLYEEVKYFRMKGLDALEYNICVDERKEILYLVDSIEDITKFYNINIYVEDFINYEYKSIIEQQLEKFLINLDGKLQEDESYFLKNNEDQINFNVNNNKLFNINEVTDIFLSQLSQRINPNENYDCYKEIERVVLSRSENINGYITDYLLDFYSKYNGKMEEFSFKRNENIKENEKSTVPSPLAYAYAYYYKSCILEKALECIPSYKNINYQKLKDNIKEIFEKHNVKIKEFGNYNIAIDNLEISMDKELTNYETSLTNFYGDFALEFISKAISVELNNTESYSMKYSDFQSNLVKEDVIKPLFTRFIQELNFCYDINSHENCNNEILSALGKSLTSAYSLEDENKNKSELYDFIIKSIPVIKQIYAMPDLKTMTKEDVKNVIQNSLYYTEKIEKAFI